MAGYTRPLVFAPTPEQQRVLDRIAQQRERIRARQTAGAKSAALAPSQSQITSASTPLATRAVTLAVRHPWFAVAMAVAALVAGPRRLVRWVDIAMPVFTQLQSLLKRHG